MLGSSLCDYSDTYILVSVALKITGPGAADVAKRTDQRDKEVIFKNCPPFTNCISEINDAQETDVVMPMYNLIKCSDN